MNPLPLVRHRLGAEELIELGRTDYPANGHQPFLAGRLRERAVLGQADVEAPVVMETPESQASGIEGFVTTTLSKEIDLLGNLSLVPLDILAKSESVTFRAVGDLLDHVPSVDVLLGEILLLGNAALQFSLPLPEKVQNGFENIIGGIAGALEATGTSAQNQKAIDAAMAAILDLASDKAKVKSVLDAVGVTGDDLTPVSFRDLTPATPPPAGVQGSLALGNGRQRPEESVLLMFSKW